MPIVISVQICSTAAASSTVQNEGAADRKAQARAAPTRVPRVRWQGADIPQAIGQQAQHPGNGHPQRPQTGKAEHVLPGGGMQGGCDQHQRQGDLGPGNGGVAQGGLRLESGQALAQPGRG